MLLNCALQEGGVMTNQAPSQPIREKNYTVGRSYDTMSGKVITMTTRDNSSDFTMKTANTDAGVVRGAPLITIREVKTPTSPLEPAPSVCGVICEPGGGMTRNLDISGGVAMTPQSPLIPPKLPLDKLSLSPAMSRKSPSPVRVVC